MVDSEPAPVAGEQQPKSFRLEPIARSLALIATALFCALSILATPFGCAVGEFEEDRNCAPSALSWASVAVLVLTIVVAATTKRRSVYWAGIAVTLVVAYAGAVQA